MIWGMLALATTENKGGLRWLGEKLNRYFEVERFEVQSPSPD
jgi:hypothetical protein